MPQSNAAPMPSVAVALTRGFQLTRNGQRIDLPHSAQRLVALVALVGRPVLRAYVAGTLWLDVAEERALANLRSALWRLRQPGCAVIETAGDRLTLDPAVRVDVRDLTDWAHGLEGPDVVLDDAHLDQLIGADELLPDWYEDWILLERERFQQLRLHALEACCDRLIGVRRYGRAIEVGLAAVATESLRESAHRALIRVYIAEGNVSAAIGQYEAYRTILWTELGLEPSALMSELISGIRSPVAGSRPTGPVAVARPAAGISPRTSPSGRMF
jgi:DNA-binding SARP family transcriptional activator